MHPAWTVLSPGSGELLSTWAAYSCSLGIGPCLVTESYLARHKLLSLPDLLVDALVRGLMDLLAGSCVGIPGVCHLCVTSLPWEEGLASSGTSLGSV